MDDSSFGDSSFEDLYKKYFGRISTFIRVQYRIGRDASQDLAQEVFGILWQKRNELIFTNEKQMVCWLYEASKIKAKEYNRLNIPNNSILSLDSEDFLEGNLVRNERPSLFEVLEDQDEKYQTYLRELKMSLNEKELVLFECIVDRGMSQRDAADYLQLSDVNLRVRWHRIRIKLKPIIEKMIEK